MKEPSEFPTHFPGQIRPGTRLSGIYEVDSLLAVGGMGEVYRGRAIETDIQVAIKVVKAEHTQSETVLALFKKEAAALHNLQHDAIVRYYVFTTDPVLHVPYLAMELVEGESLSDIIARGPLPIESVLLLQRRIASALDTAHRAGVVHRDISPDNIILPGRDPGRAKLIDFGIARSAFGGGTVIGDRFAGKQNYASPEQVGLFGATVGPKSDIYSLGLTLAAAALGAPLDMGGTQLDVIRKRQALPDLRQTDPLIRPLLLKMLQPKPDDRPAGMAEVAEWRPGGRGGDRKPGERRWLVPALAGAVVVLAAGAGALGWLQLRESPSSPAASRQAAAPASSRPGELPPSYAAPGAAQQPGSGLTLPPPSVTPAEAPAELSSRQPAGGVALGPATPPPAAGPQPGVAVAPAPVRAPPPPLRRGGFRDCDGCPELVAIPAGRFRMGSNADPTERPVREVAVEAFAAGRYPVTVREWRECVARKGCAFDPGGDPAEPVHNLSWDDAQGYIAWLSAETGRTYRLLSEAEWEYAGRARTTTRYWWGEEFSPDLASCRGPGCTPLRAPPPVGSFAANTFGLYDVTGSVDQWTADCWHKDYRGAPRDSSPWISTPCRERVLRGGSWNQDPATLTISSRESYDASVRYPGHGFRVARDM